MHFAKPLELTVLKGDRLQQFEQRAPLCQGPLPGLRRCRRAKLFFHCGSRSSDPYNTQLVSHDDATYQACGGDTCNDQPQ